MTPTQFPSPVGSMPVETSQFRDFLAAQLPLVASVVASTCRQHHLCPEDADDFAGHVRLKLVERDYEILRRFEGRSSLRTYLTIVIKRLFLDYRVAQWGRWRPCLVAREAGAAAVWLDRLMTRDGMNFGEAFEVLRGKFTVTPSRDALYQLSQRLAVRTRRRTIDLPLDEIPAPDGHAETALSRERAVALAAVVKEALKGELANLSADDRRLLELRFRDGRQVAQIARLLGRDAKPLYRRLQAVVRGLRGRLAGIGREHQPSASVLSMADTSISW